MKHDILEEHDKKIERLITQKQALEAYEPPRIVIAILIAGALGLMFLAGKVAVFIGRNIFHIPDNSFWLLPTWFITYFVMYFIIGYPINAIQEHRLKAWDKKIEAAKIEKARIVRKINS